MRGIWIRRLLPASVVGIVLAFSYFLPALGFVAPPVSSATHTNCGHFGYGYHGGKHDFVCPTHGPQPAGGVAAPVVGSQQARAGAHGSTITQAAPPQSNGLGGAAMTTGIVVDAPLTDGVGEWRAFIKLVLTELR
jgi:hypothetical protein